MSEQAKEAARLHEELEAAQVRRIAAAAEYEAAYQAYNRAHKALLVAKHRLRLAKVARSLAARCELDALREVGDE